MAQRRELRVRELLKREVGESIRRVISLEEAGLVSVNEVGVASDLRSAIVFISVLGNADQRKRAPEIIAKYGPLIQTMVAQRVRLKFTPKLHFRLDDSVARGDQVLALLAEIEKDLAAKETPPAGPTGPV